MPQDRRDWLKSIVEENSSVRQGSVQACAVLEDHVHLCVTLPPTVMLATFIGEVKGASCRAYNQNHQSDIKLEWQRGYGIVTIRKSDLDVIIPYIENNVEIHSKRKGLMATLERAEDAEAPCE